MLDWSGEAGKRPKWLQYLGVCVISSPWLAAVIAATAAAQKD